jgi:invasion protein IalB
MTVTLRTFVIAFAVAFSPLAVGAQTTETDDETAAETDGASVPGTDLAIGQPVNEDGLGRTYVKDNFGDWEMRCIKTESGNDPCQLYQLLIDGEENPVAEINLFVVNGNEQIVGGATIVTPLETLLTANLRLAVDNGEPRAYPFSFCRTIGCFSRLGLAEAEVDQFRKGTSANVVIVPAAAPDQTVELKASLSGFTAGWNALVEVSKPADQ